MEDGYESFYESIKALKDAGLPDTSSHLSKLARNRKESPLKTLFKYLRPGMGALAGGMPSPAYFPIETLAAHVPKSDALLKNTFLSTTSGDNIYIPKYPTSDPINLSTLLQYGQATGLPKLNEFLREFTLRAHKPAYKGWGILMSCGNTDTLNKTFQMLLEPGSSVIVEEYTYPSALASFEPYGAVPVAVKCDADGLVPKDLKHILDSWDYIHGPRPKLIYTVPVGQNPTGSTQPLERRKELYEIVKSYDMILLEDDPYYFLQMDEYEGSFSDRKTPSFVNLKGQDYLDNLTPSYLRIDTEGRVIRADSFSKVVAPGSRAGWIVANPMFIERLSRISETCTQATSGFAQAFIAKLLIDDWGMDKWIEWLKGIASEYQLRRDYFCTVLGKAVGYSPQSCSRCVGKKNLVTFVPPVAGMFIWMNVHVEHHPRYNGSNQKDLTYDLWQRLIERDILVVPGYMFAATKKQENACFYRISFSIESRENLKSAADKIGDTIREFFKT